MLPSSRSLGRPSAPARGCCQLRLACSLCCRHPVQPHCRVLSYQDPDLVTRRLDMPLALASTQSSIRCHHTSSIGRPSTKPQQFSKVQLLSAMRSLPQNTIRYLKRVDLTTARSLLNLKYGLFLMSPIPQNDVTEGVFITASRHGMVSQEVYELKPSCGSDVISSLSVLDAPVVPRCVARILDKHSTSSSRKQHTRLLDIIIDPVSNKQGTLTPPIHSSTT